MVLLLVTVSGVAMVLGACHQTTTVVDCVVGAHQPAGRQDVCVPDTIPQATRVTLLTAARTAAQENHGTVTRAIAIKALRSNVFRDLGDTVTGADGFVWVVEIGGHFQCGRTCFGAPGAPRPTGTAIVETLDVRTLTVTGFSLVKKWVDLSNLGPVHVIA